MSAIGSSFFKSFTAVYLVYSRLFACFLKVYNKKFYCGKLASLCFCAIVM